MADRHAALPVWYINRTVKLGGQVDALQHVSWPLQGHVKPRRKYDSKVVCMYVGPAVYMSL